MINTKLTRAVSYLVGKWGRDRKRDQEVQGSFQIIGYTVVLDR